MDPSEWVDWQRLNPRTLTPSQIAERPCTDCPVSYAVGMRAVGLCNGTPGGDDVSEGNGVGTLNRPSVVGKQFRDAEVEVTAVLPCEKCAHAAVCRIKPILEARLETLPVTLPTLDPAISFTLSAEVKCGQFLRGRPVGNPVSGFMVKGAAPSGYQRTPEHQARINEANRRRAAEKKLAEREA